MKPIRSIVVGTDFSDLANRALDDALDVATQVGATVILVHAYDLLEHFPDGMIVSTPEAARAITTAGLEGLAAAALSRKHRGVPVKTRLRMGAPWDELNAVAEEEDADVIVVGSHGRRGISRALLGSVAERTVRTATRPVLTVRGGR